MCNVTLGHQIIQTRLYLVHAWPNGDLECQELMGQIICSTRCLSKQWTHSTERPVDSIDWYMSFYGYRNTRQIGRSTGGPVDQKIWQNISTLFTSASPAKINWNSNLVFTFTSEYITVLRGRFETSSTTMGLEDVIHNTFQYYSVPVSPSNTCVDLSNSSVALCLACTGI